MSQGSVRIGKIAGIDIELHWLFILLILVFIIFEPLVGLILVLLFVCVLLHELSHSITAMRNGIRVSKIILLPIGGASIIDQITIAPEVEFSISIAGPIASLLLGGLFGILVVFTPPGIITLIVQNLFVINILLGLLNLLPAFPMDGGRVFRSYLQRKYSSYDATMMTAKASRYVMVLIIIATLLWVARPIGSIGYKESLILIDFITVFFLYEGTKAEEGNAIITRETKGLTVKDVIGRGYAQIRWEAPIRDLFPLLKRSREHVILTKAPDGRYQLVNVFDQASLGRAARISDLAVEIPNVQDSSTITDALSKIEATQFRIGAVLKGNKLVGIATGQHISAFITLHMSGRTARKGFK